MERIGLGVITHRRPAGLRALLESYAQMNVPKGTECVVLVAENDSTSSNAQLVAKMEPLLPFPVRYQLEPRRGIPVARNRVLDMALAEGCDYLTFVDDDAVVHKDWLVILHNTLVGRGVDLAGGPGRLEGSKGVSLSWHNQLVLRNIRASNAKVMRSKMIRVATEQEKDVEIYTNNWMLRLSKQQETGVRFDETLRFSGGSDRKFFLDFVQKGGTTAWSSDARVIEFWPPERLTLNYIFARIRDQEIMRRICNDDVPSMLSALCDLTVSIFRAFWFILQAPLTRFRTVPKAVKTVALAVGRVQAARGKHSQLYAPALDDEVVGPQ